MRSRRGGEAPPRERGQPCTCVFAMAGLFAACAPKPFTLTSTEDTKESLNPPTPLESCMRVRCLPLPFSLPILPIPLPRCIPSDPPSHFCVNSRPNLFIRAGHHRNQKIHEHDVENEKGQDEKHERSVIVELMQVEVAERLHGGASQRERTSRVERIYTVSTTSSQRDSEKLQR